MSWFHVTRSPWLSGLPLRVLGVGLVCGVLVACTPEAEQGDDDMPGHTAGPLEELLGLGPQEFSAEAEIERARQQQEAIATCMSEQGFAYWPAIPGPDQVVLMEGPVAGEREFAELYGFGMTIPLDSRAGGVSIAADNPPEMDAYLDSLSPSARAAYDDALYGGTESCAFPPSAASSWSEREWAL